MHSANQLLFLLLILLSIQISGCQKEPLSNQQKEIGGAVLRDGTAIGAGQPITIEEATAWFDNMADPTDFSVENFKLFSLDPAWLQSYSTNVGEVEGLLVPVFNDLDSIFPNSFYNLFFFHDSTDIVCRLLVFKSYNDVPVLSNVDLNTFNGVMFQVFSSDNVGGFARIQNGVFTPLVIEFPVGYLSGATTRDFWEWLVGLFKPDCPNPNGSWWKHFWEDFDIWFSMTSGGGNDTSWGWGAGFNFGTNLLNGSYWNSYVSTTGWSGSSGGIGALGISTSQTPLNISALFNNKILNRGFRELRKCQQVISDDPDQNDSQFDNTNLALILANGNFSNPNNFYPIIVESIDKLLINDSQNGNESFKSILEGVMSNYSPIGNNQGYNPQFLDPMAALFASKYIYEKNRAIFELCSNDLSEMPASGEDLYEHGICNCMDNYSLDNTINDYFKAYFKLPSSQNQPIFTNSIYLSNLIEILANLDPNLIYHLGFGDVCSLESEDFIHCASEYIFQNSNFSELGNLLHLNESEYEFFQHHSDLFYDYISFLKTNPDPIPVGTALYKFLRWMLNSEEEKSFFDAYMYGTGASAPNRTVVLSETAFNDIIFDVINKAEVSQPEETIFNGNPAIKRSVSLNSASKWDLVFGTFTVYFDLNGTPIGLYDKYDFDPVWGDTLKEILGYSHRGLYGEWGTRITALTDLINQLNPPFNPSLYYIVYP